MSTTTAPPSDEPWLSVLLPVHAVGAWLDDCVASILAQQAGGIELVFVDDASPGDEARRLVAWQARHPDLVRIVTHAHNRGVAAARNTLLAQARGRYLWFVDPDDLMLPGALQSLRAIVEREAPDLVLCDFRSFRPGEDPVDGPAPRDRSARRRAHQRSFDGPAGRLLRDRDALVAGLLRAGQLHPWTKIVRRAAWPAGLRFPEGRVFEDLAVFPRLALAVDSFHYAPQAWIAYRQREGSILSTLSACKLDDWTQALAGYAQDVRASGAALSPQTAFEIAHFSARTWLRARRRQRGLPATDPARASPAEERARWASASPLSARELAWAYLKRGHLGRWAQLYRALREGG